MKISKSDLVVGEDVLILGQIDELDGVRCGGLQVLLTGIEDASEEQEMQVHRAGAHPRRRRDTSKSTTASPTATSSPSRNGSRLEGLPTTNHNFSLKVAKESGKAAKAAVLGPVFAKIGPDTPEVCISINTSEATSTWVSAIRYLRSYCATTA
jgi:hypothetical protein